MARRLALGMATMAIVAFCSAGYGATPDAGAPSKPQPVAPGKKANPAGAAPSTPVSVPRSYARAVNGNTDYPGNDITYWKGPFSGCAAACDQTPGCVAYTLHKDNGANCWLKSALPKGSPKPTGNSTPNANRDTFQVQSR